jgi:hypothetical protein
MGCSSKLEVCKTVSQTFSSGQYNTFYFTAKDLTAGMLSGFVEVL